MNNSEEDVFVIHTGHLSGPIDLLGNYNTKNITVYGDAGWRVGEGMESGSIIVNGNSGEGAGTVMKGGVITVRGNAGTYVGTGLGGGRITVEGSAGNDVGYSMHGGTIIVNGSAEGYVGHNMDGGLIVVNGNAGDIGLGMKGGEVHLFGDCFAISSNVWKGKIFHKEKLIFPK
jgi:formylmethanofuran dehydrogenase subunit C